MKQIGLAMGLIKKSFFSYIILFVLVFITAYHILVSMGYIEYRFYGVNAVQKYLYNADYFMKNNAVGNFNLNVCEEFRKKAEKYEGVKGVIYKISGRGVLTADKNGGGEQKIVTVIMYSEDYSEFYREKLSYGEYTENSIVNEKYQCITNLSGVSIGDSFYIFHHISENENDTSLIGELQISGRLYSDESILSMECQGNAIDLTSNFSSCYQYYDDIVIIPYSKEYLESVKEYLYSTIENYYILYEDDITDKQKEYIRKQISDDGFFYTSMSEALERTLQQKKTAVRERIFIPMTYIYLCAMAFIVVSVIASYKYMKEFSVYYIVGYTRRKIMGIINLSLAPVMLSAIIYGVILINNYDKIEALKMDKLLNIGYVMYNSFIMYIILFLLILLFISNILIAAIISRISPIKLYRQLNN